MMDNDHDVLALCDEHEKLIAALRSIRDGLVEIQNRSIVIEDRPILIITAKLLGGFPNVE